MPGRKVHTIAGAVAGGTYACHKAARESEFNRLVETGADILEPALTPIIAEWRTA